MTTSAHKTDQSKRPKNECFSTSVFTGKEKDSETGFYNFGARYYDSDLSGLFLSVDPMADKYPSLSPYAYCAWNPVRLVDPNGDSVAVLLAGNTLGHEGHMAILVQNESGKWELWSKNGEGKSSSENKSASSNDKPYSHTYDNVQQFLDDYKGNSNGHNGSSEPYYTEAYMIPTTSEQDKTIQEKMTTFMSSYHLLSDNCADAVKKSLNAAGIKTEKDYMEGFNPIVKALIMSSHKFQRARHFNEDVIPATMYKNIKDANPGGIVFKPGRRKQ